MMLSSKCVWSASSCSEQEAKIPSYAWSDNCDGLAHLQRVAMLVPKSMAKSDEDDFSETLELAGVVNATNKRKQL